MKKERENRKIKFDIFSRFLFELSELDSLLLEFDTKLSHSLVDYATVYHGGRMVFTFGNGTEIETKI